MVEANRVFAYVWTQARRGNRYCRAAATEIRGSVYVIGFNWVPEFSQLGSAKLILVVSAMILATIYQVEADEVVMRLAQAEKNQSPTQEELDALEQRPKEEKIYTVGCIPRTNTVTILNSNNEIDVNNSLSLSVSRNWRNWDFNIEEFYISDKRQIASGHLATPGHNKHFLEEKHYVFTSEWACTIITTSWRALYGKYESINPRRNIYRKQ